MAAQSKKIGPFSPLTLQGAKQKNGYGKMIGSMGGSKTTALWFICYQYMYQLLKSGLLQGLIGITLCLIKSLLI
jgi:hypothetical protein